MVAECVESNSSVGLGDTGLSISTLATLHLFAPSLGQKIAHLENLYPQGCVLNSFCQLMVASNCFLKSESSFLAPWNSLSATSLFPLIYSRKPRLA